MKLIIRNRSRLLLLTLLYLIGSCIHWAITYAEYPQIRSHRGETVAAVLIYFLTYSIVFSYFTPRLKIKYQTMVSILVTLVLLVEFIQYLPITFVFGILIAMIVHVGYYFLRLFRIRNR